MKKRLVILLLGVATSLIAWPIMAKGDIAFSAGLEIRSPGDFYEPLAPSGAWVEVRSYGRCWHPARLGAGWRPYSVGHWEWTDCGWYWVSDEPWAWACYHYGSWVYDPKYGWVWVPGTEWAPAWVVWREGGDYIGWAPCGPGGVALELSWFAFVDIHHFHDRFRPSSLIVNNTTILNRTRVIGGFKREPRTFDGARQIVVINQGPSLDPVQKATGTQFKPVPVREMIRQTPAPTAIKRAKPEGPSISEPRQPTGPSEPKRTIPEPSGRDQPRVYPETQPRPAPSEKPSKVQPERPPAPVAPPEKPPSATGRERGYERTPPPPRERVEPPSQRPPSREAPPAKPERPPPEKGKGHEKDKDNP